MANQEKQPLKVFLCHASGDKPPVRDLYKRLTAEGVDAWLDKEKLLPGQDWQLEIPKAVKEADVVVVCLSNRAVTKEGYVQKEIKFALDIAEEKPEGTIFLIPACLEECTVPERLSRWQWVNLYEDDGFTKLLRSLKLRANAVNATVEPISYFGNEDELETRIEQLYTEGLEAFYIHDWDKACYKFQVILRERPHHKSAIEKLAEAERQRDFLNLYKQAMEAIQSEKLDVAIKNLEELNQKTANYKDAAQLLANAKKRKQLKELYAEAKALSAAEKWQAVVRVFEQIYSIDPNFADADGLRALARKKVAELERQSELSKLYGHAVREMDAGRWQEAHKSLKQIQKIQFGFLESERLLAQVEAEIKKTPIQPKNKKLLAVVLFSSVVFIGVIMIVFLRGVPVEFSLPEAPNVILLYSKPEDLGLSQVANTLSQKPGRDFVYLCKYDVSSDKYLLANTFWGCEFGDTLGWAYLGWVYDGPTPNWTWKYVPKQQ